MPQLMVGPLLGIESNSSYTICFSTPKNTGSASIRFNGTQIGAIKIGTTPSSIVWRCVVDVASTKANQKYQYQVFIDGKKASSIANKDEWTVYVPGSATRPKLAYASCNGFSKLEYMQRTDAPYALWEKMAKEHRSKPFSLLLMGGDQLYADSIWESIDWLQTWNGKSRKAKVKRLSATDKGKLQKEVDVFYDDLYQTRWSHPDMNTLMASIPNVMMWDDHDIFDGWGSYPPDMQKCDVHQIIYETAKRYFELFQIRSRRNVSLLDNTAEHYAFGFSFRNFHILAIDNRAQRTLNQVMGKDQWKSFLRHLGSVDKSRDLLLLSGVPVVYRDFSSTESAFDFTPWEEELTDDLKDHWRAKEHQGERARLIFNLLDSAKDRTLRKTVILSGDVHIGCIGVIRNRVTGDNIHQVVSSGIVHPSPSRIEWLGIMASANDDDEYLDENRNIQASMLHPFSSDKYIRSRNYVSLLEGTDEKLWVNWVSEGLDNPSYPIQ